MQGVFVNFWNISKLVDLNKTQEMLEVDEL